MQSRHMMLVFGALLTLGVAVSPPPAAAQATTAPAVVLSTAPAADAAVDVATVSGDAAAPDLSPEARDMRAALIAEIADLPQPDREAIEAFYAGRDFAPYWTDPGAERIRVLVAALERSPEHGLPLRRYDPGALEAIFASDPDQSPEALREVASTRTYLAYARDLHGGLLTPSRIDAEISITPVRPGPGALLDRLGRAPLDEVLAGLEPASPEYRALMSEKARLETRLRTEELAPTVAAGPTLRDADFDPRVRQLRTRLARLGYDAPADGTAAEYFDPGLAAAVTRFQTDAGLVEDGAVGPRTLDMINTTLESRLTQVVVNLERLRWLNRDLGARRIMVNIPDYTVTLYDADAPVWQTRAVVGQAAETRTPEFSDTMSYMVVNPTWHIPDSIAKRVYLPKLRSDPGVLDRSGMRLFTRAGTEIDPGLVNFNALGGSFPFRIKQNPSDSNALGRVKFMFPNQFAIYLHDTPHRELFARDARAFSNGCIRLEDPLELAYTLLDGQVDDPRAAFDGWLAAKSERQVNLERPIPVHLTYRTVFVDADGVLRYRHDVYGRDARVFEALEAAGVTLPAAQG